ncbi:MAG: sigma-70 family RNA polymerase sigma factor [Pirellulales bacterium]
MTNWDDIVADLGPMVWRTLWRLLADRADVEECFQETFVSALKLSRRETVTSWPAALCTLATARGMDRLRQRYRRGNRAREQCGELDLPQHQLHDTASHSAGPVEQAVVAELAVRLRLALAQLPERQAEVFYLYAIDGWTHRDIGEQLQMTENAVGVTVHRARQRLRQLLDDCQ